MKSAILYTGTFDPCHRAHIRQMIHSYEARPFDKAVMAVIRENPKKPSATPWLHRVELARMIVRESELPFPVEIRTIDYVREDTLRAFVQDHLAGYSITRTMASDSFVEFLEDKQFHGALSMFPVQVVVRPLMGKEEVLQSLARLDPEVASALSYEIIYVQTTKDISATNIRKDPKGAQQEGLISLEQLRYIQENGLYL